MIIEELSDKEKSMIEILKQHKGSKQIQIFNILYPHIKELREKYSLSFKSIVDLIEKEFGFTFSYPYFTAMYKKKSSNDS